MAMFVSDKAVAITAAGVTDEKDITPTVDAIFIKPKMDYGTRQRVVGAAAKLEQSKSTSAKGNRAQRRAAKKRGESDVSFDVGAYQIALLAHNIVRWSGPSFAGVACTPANIARLDPAEPLVQLVIQEISDRNTDPDAAGDDDEDTSDPNAIDLVPLSSSSTA